MTNSLESEIAKTFFAAIEAQKYLPSAEVINSWVRYSFGFLVALENYDLAKIDFITLADEVNYSSELDLREHVETIFELASKLSAQEKSVGIGHFGRKYAGCCQSYGALFALAIKDENVQQRDRILNLMYEWQECFRTSCECAAHYSSLTRDLAEQLREEQNRKRKQAALDTRDGTQNKDLSSPDSITYQRDSDLYEQGSEESMLAELHLDIDKLIESVEKGEPGERLTLIVGETNILFTVPRKGWISVRMLDVARQLGVKRDCRTSRELSRRIAGVLTADDNTSNRFEKDPGYVRRVVKGKTKLLQAESTQDILSKVSNYRIASSAGVPPKSSAIIDILEEAAAVTKTAVNTIQDAQESISYRYEASERGSPHSAKRYADLVASSRVPYLAPSQSIPNYRYAASIGDSSAYETLGEIYEQGAIVTRNDVEALRYYDRHTLPIFLNRTFEGGSVDGNVSDEARYRFLHIGDSIYEGKGFNPSNVIEVFKLANVYWKKAAGLIDPYTGSLEIGEIRKIKFDKVASLALGRLARSVYFGFGQRQNRALAFKLWLMTLEQSELSRRYFWLYFNEFRKGSELIRQLAMRRLTRICIAVDDVHISSKIDQLNGISISDRLSRVSKSDEQSDTSAMLILLLKLLYPSVSDWQFDYERFISKGYLEKTVTSFQLKALFIDSARLEYVRHIVEKLESTYSKELSAASLNEVLGNTHAIGIDTLCKYLDRMSRIDEQGISDIFALRCHLAEHCEEPGRFRWGFLRRRQETRSICLFQSLGVDSRRTLAKNRKQLIKSTAEFGPDPSARDPFGFLKGERAKDHRNFVERRRNPGWDRVNKLSISTAGFKILEARRTPDKYLPLIFNTDIELLLILAILETRDCGDEVKPPSFSLEKPEGVNSTWNFSVNHKKYLNPSWLGVTDFGKSLYYHDTLMFADHTGDQIISATDPLQTMASHGDMFSIGSIWTKAKFCGGVQASAVMRCSFHASHKLVGASDNGKTPSPGNFTVDVPMELAHFDGSEIYFDGNGEEVHRDGGRALLRYHATRRTEVLTRGIHEVYESFPIYQRVALLHGLYATLRSYFSKDRREELEGSELIKQLEKARRRYISKFEKSNSLSQYTILP
ncbi:MAG: hypothetical protein AAF542_07305 [Pseudomonadota bacterium]